MRQQARSWALISALGTMQAIAGARQDTSSRTSTPNWRRARIPVIRLRLPEEWSKHRPFLGEGHDQDAVRGGNAHTHDGSHKSGNAERCVREEEKQNDSSQRCGECGNDDERVKPGLKVHYDEQVHQDDCKAQATDQADVGGAHRTVLAAKRIVRYLYPGRSPGQEME